MQRMAAPTSVGLPIDVWLLVFEHIDDLDALWSVVRNVSRFLRDCVDEHFRHGVLPNTLIDLHYTTIHAHSGPSFSYLHMPMHFSRLSSHGTHAVFHQMAYTHYPRLTAGGSVRGWVPFIERYCRETIKPQPVVLRKSSSNKSPPLWEQEHLNLRNTLVGEDKTSYTRMLRDHISIGRGDRPPYHLKIHEYINDTELVGLQIDWELCQLSFDWRRTFSAFFQEQHFIALADRNLGKKRAYDDDLNLAAARIGFDITRQSSKATIDARRARRKRLQPWAAKNKHRMTPEHRWQTENAVEHDKFNVQRNLRHDNLRSLVLEELDCEELVPERCADDLPYLLMWPWGGENTFFAPRKPLRCNPNCCTIL